jgi:hypothetical protein
MNHYSERVEAGRCGVLVYKQKKKLSWSTKSGESLQKTTWILRVYFQSSIIGIKLDIYYLSGILQMADSAEYQVFAGRSLYGLVNKNNTLPHCTSVPIVTNVPLSSINQTSSKRYNIITFFVTFLIALVLLCSPWLQTFITRKPKGLP